MNNTEIERKWLLDGFPDLPVQRRALMEQGYLAYSPNTVRIRRVAEGPLEETQERYFLTIKGKGTLVRTEVELEIAADQYAALYGLLAGPAVPKQYRTYALPGGLTLECNLVDQGDPGAFYYAEVEFASEAAAAAFQPPPFLGREVTGEPGYTMAAYTLRKAGLGE